jgi:hypothetical protein
MSSNWRRFEVLLPLQFYDTRDWMKDFKARWKAKLDQLELWVVSYRIDIE